MFAKATHEPDFKRNTCDSTDVKIDLIFLTALLLILDRRNESFLDRIVRVRCRRPVHLHPHSEVGEVLLGCKVDSVQT